MPRLRCSVGAAQRDPVVVEHALRAVRRVASLQTAAGTDGLAEGTVVRAQERMTEPVDAGVLAVARRQGGARVYGRAASRAHDLRAEVHHEAHAESGRAVRVVGRGDVAL